MIGDNFENTCENQSVSVDDLNPKPCPVGGNTQDLQIRVDRYNRIIGPDQAVHLICLYQKKSDSRENKEEYKAREGNPLGLFRILQYETEREYGPTKNEKVTKLSDENSYLIGWGDKF